MSAGVELPPALAHKIGPLPAGAWVVVIAGALYIGHKRNTAPAAATTTSGPVPSADGTISTTDAAPLTVSPIITLPSGNLSGSQVIDAPPATSGPSSWWDMLPGASDPQPLPSTVPIPQPTPSTTPAVLAPSAPAASAAPSTRALSTFDKLSLSKLRQGLTVTGGDGRVFQLRNGVPTTVYYHRPGT